MVELSSCASLVNPSTLCAISRGCSLDFSVPLATLDCEDRETKVEGIDVVAELQRERQRNAELKERISVLEAEIQKREKASLSIDEQGHCSCGTDRSFKRQKIEPVNNVDAKVAQSCDQVMEIPPGSSCMAMEITNQQSHLVNWMSMDETQILNFEKFKDGDFNVDCEDTDDTDDDADEYDEEDTDIDDKDKENDDIYQVSDALKDHVHDGVNNGGEHLHYSGRSPGAQNGVTILSTNQEIHNDQNRGTPAPDMKSVPGKKEAKKQRRKESKKNKGCKALVETQNYGQEIVHKGSGAIASNKKPLKVAFCPKEVKRIIESEVLSIRNAQSHTIRKIIVFASLGIRHGCEDMYELDFNHFRILQKGEPYVSPKNPGEHVLYEHPGVRRKVFYPNRENPTLCPVRILEEEKTMRPSGLSCPSCLFLCIKYGGRTRNLPQNEYVRQRMGRNKLKSFGPLMCRVGMLVHVRSGSFFFKALGITLLFMAGFPDDLVQRETKYRNLDLLQKYYRTDEDAEGEELFHLHPMIYDSQVSPNSQQFTGKTTKSSGKKQTGLTIKPQISPRSLTVPSVPSSSVPSTQFGLMGYTSLQPHAMAGFQAMPSHTTISDTPPMSNPSIAGSSPNISYHTGQAPPYSMIPPHPSSPFMPMVYWPHPNSYSSCPFPPSYGFRSFPQPGNYMPLHPQAYYGHPSCPPFMSNAVEGTEKKDAPVVEANSNSDSSSSTEPKKA